MNTGKWVAVWGTSPSNAVPAVRQYAKNMTLRYRLRAMLSGRCVRLHLNNLFGREDVVITRMFIGGKEREVLPVTFGGETTCRLRAGERVISDAIDFPLMRGQDYFVSFYMEDFTLLDSGVEITGPLCHIHFAEGDYAAAPVLPEVHTAYTNSAFFLDTVDVLTDDADAHALVCYGDSITAQAWPDYLMLRVLQDVKSNLAVIRRGISGSRVLRQYDTLLSRHYGPKGSERFEREVSAAGVDRVVILHGVNDMIHPDGSSRYPWSDFPAAEELIGGLRWYVDKGHELGKKVYLATIMPLKGWNAHFEKREAVRAEVNAWIRMQKEADGIVDFDLISRDPDDPQRLWAGYDCGDHLHPSWSGAKNMAESIPAEYLK